MVGCAHLLFQIS